jgi:flagellar biosynthesis protein FlhF
MRMKTFSAPTMTEAMELVRFEMGADSIIVATRDDKDGAVITAAMEDTAPNGLKNSEIPIIEEKPVFNELDTEETIRQSLSFHGLPTPLLERLARISGGIAADSPTLALAAAMDETFTFDPVSSLLTDTPGKNGACRILLMGPPGVGKTITTAKLAALVALGKVKPKVISTDTQRAGGIEQLAAFTRILEIDLKSANNANDLFRLLEGDTGEVPILIDTPGTNPYDSEEMDHLAALADAARAENVLVMPASGDSMESADIAGEFSNIGAKRLLVTRLDMARRLGSILTCADAGRLSLSDVSITPSVAEGITPINPVSLARLIMPYTDTISAGDSHRTDHINMTEAAL